MSGPVYTFYPDTPNASDPMNETQPLILSNFQAIPELLGVNHVTWSDNNASNSFGGHNFLSLLNITPPGTSDIEMALFTEVTPDGPNVCELFVQYPTDAQTSELVVKISEQQATNPEGTSGIVNVVQGATTLIGYCIFPSGVKFWWGLGSCQYGPLSYVPLVSPYVYTQAIYNAGMSPKTSSTGAANGTPGFNLNLYLGTALPAGITGPLISFGGSVSTTNTSASFYFICIGI